MASPEDVTEILLRAGAGTPGTVDRLFAVLYAELRGSASACLRRERADHTLQPTALVHEAYLRLVDQSRCEWKNRAQFLAVASRAMRRVLVDHARGRGRVKRGGGWERRPLEEAFDVATDEGATTMLELEAALERLEQRQPEKARVVELRFFGGLTHEECAETLGVSPRTVARWWDYAQAWLYRELASDDAAA